MKKLNKKGFTIVELVIVIAVIAILAAVLIPTFTSVVNNAKKSADQSAAKADLDLVLVLKNGDLAQTGTTTFTAATSGVTYTFVGAKYYFTYNTVADANGNHWSQGTEIPSGGITTTGLTDLTSAITAAGDTPSCTVYEKAN